MKRELSEGELRCLRVLDAHYDSDEPYLYFRTIAGETNIEIKVVRRLVRRLARLGLAEYMKGLFNEEGRAAGSGYGATQAGRSYIKALEKQGNGIASQQQPVQSSQRSA